MRGTPLSLFRDFFLPHAGTGHSVANASPVEEFKKIKSAEWSRIQEESSLRLFSRMAAKVPAYGRFLKEQAISAEVAKEHAYLSQVPPISKKNYLHIQPFQDLFWDTSLRTPHILTSTSGSTGRPTYFARSSEVDRQSSVIHELIFNASSLKKDESTLVIVCFGMGVWIGGLITYQAFQLLSERGYPLSIITPGINKVEILKTLRDLAPHYKQIILAGYPPFLKDVIDDAIEQNIDLKKHQFMLLFAAEAFTEKFRDHVAKKAAIANVLTNTTNIYGSADLGTMAFETPISILTRRLATAHPDFFNALFNGTAKTPTLAQFVPSYTSFEELNGELLVTGDSAVPLMRYAIGDHGGVHTFKEVVALAKAHGVDLLKEAKEVDISGTLLELPFVYVYERADLATTLYGLQIYPETIKEVLLDPKFHPMVTGKLTLITKYDENQDQYLEVNIELRPRKGTDLAFASKLKEALVKNLRAKNSEFHELHDFLGARAEPRFVFWGYEEAPYFKPGVKQPWVMKDA